MGNRITNTARSGITAAVLLLLLFGTHLQARAGARVRANSGPVLNPANGHWYEAVAAHGSWADANRNSQTRVFQGMPGHLATLTSLEEHEWVRTTFPTAQSRGYFLGGYQPPGSAEPADGWRWVTGEAWSFTRWAAGQPDNYFGEQDRLAFVPSGSGWDDEYHWEGREGYVIEYEPEPAAAPASPGELKAVGLSSTEIVLRWIDGSSNETGFELERRIGESPYEVIARLPAGSTSYWDPDRTEGITYTYRIRSVNDFGASAYSNEASSRVATSTLVFNPANGHWYEGVLCGGPILWEMARDAAAARAHNGMRGHLVTVTSAAENQFIASALPQAVQGIAWLGGFQAPKSSEPGGGWSWVTGEPWSYTNWDFGQPSDTAAEEHVLHYWRNFGKWNDVAQNTQLVSAFIVEYEAPAAGDLHVARASTDRVDLAWTDSRTDEVSWEVERRTRSTNFARIALLPANTSTYSDAEVLRDTFYSYRVRAVLPGGVTPYTNEASASTSGPISFLAPASYNVSPSEGLASADLDGDGRADLLAYGGGSVALLFGRGDGTLEEPVYLEVGAAFDPEWGSVSAEDVDRDGRLDLVAAVGAEDALVVRRNLGRRSFAAAVRYPAGDLPKGLTIADFNRDGWPDAAVANHGSRTVSVHLNRRDGTFAPAVHYLGSGGYPGFVASADFNGDENPDLAVAHYVTDDVAVFLGNGAGEFAPHALYPCGSLPESLLAADLTQDGVPDLLSISSRINRLDALWNGGAGTFTVGPSSGLGAYARRGSLADLDLDGDLDACIAVLTGLEVRANRGDGLLVDAGLFPGEARGNRAVAIGDFNGDGRPDAAVSSRETPQISVYLNATDTGAPPPEAPTGLTASAVSPRRIDLSWTFEGAAAGFRVERRAEGDDTFTQVGSVTGDVTSYHDEEVLPASTYHYRVRAWNARGVSAPSEVASASTPDEIPAAPSELQAVPKSARRVDLTWSDVSRNEARFEIERRVGMGAFSHLAEIDADVTFYSDTTASANGEHTYRVRARNSTGASDYSATATALTYPDPPTGLTLEVLGQQLIRLTWQDTTSGDTGYQIERKPGPPSAPGSYLLVATTASDAVLFVDGGVSAAATYTYRVRTRNATGPSEPSAEVTGTTLPNAPEAPFSVRGQALSANSVEIRWAHLGGTLSGFRVERSSGGEFARVGSADPPARLFVDQTAEPETTYRYRVRAFNDGGESAPSAEVTITTPPGPPTMPLGLQASVRPGPVVDLTWLHLGEGVSGFRVERSSGTGFVAIATRGAGDRAYSDHEVEANRRYRYRVIAFHGGADSAPSAEVEVSTPPDPPAAPGALTATVLSDTSIRLTWDDPGDSETGFRIERRSGVEPFALLRQLEADTEEYLDTGLDPETIYVYRIQAENAGGRSAFSSEVSATTHPAPRGKLGVARKVRFPQTAVGSTRTVSLVLRNLDRRASLRVTVESPASPFGLEGGAQTFVIPNGQRNPLRLTFSPGVKGRARGRLIIRSSDPSRPVVTIKLEGNGFTRRRRGGNR